MDGRKGRVAHGVNAFRIASLIAQTRAVIAWERFWGLAWKATLVAGAFLALSLSDQLPRLGPGLHFAVLCLFVIGFLTTLSPLKNYRFPSEKDAIRRLEKSSGLKHRPLSALADKPALAEGNADLWLRHLLQAAKSLQELKPERPKSPVPLQDPNAIRFAVLLALFIAAVAGSNDPLERVNRALVPNWFALTGGQDLTVEAWITPPDYTGYPPVFLSLDHPPDPIAPPSVPQGSHIKLHVTGVTGIAAASIGGTSLFLENIGSTAFNGEGTITDGEALELRSGKSVLQTWPLNVIPDHPPRIELAQQPQANPDTQETTLFYHASDDFGLKEVSLALRLAGQDQEEPLTLSLPRPGRHGSMVRYRKDLTDHPWAGSEVEMFLTAVDNAAQVGQSAKHRFTLPERHFQHPIARRLAEARKRLVNSGPVRLDVASDLGIIASHPEKFGHDTIVILGLSVAESRLIYNTSKAAIESVRSLLWNLALRLDKGLAALARRELTESQEALRQALERGADQETLERLMDQMADAMRQFLDQMSQGISPENMPDLSLPEGLEAVGRDQLNEMLEEARRLMRLGDIAGAQALLDQLKQMLESLAAQQPSDGLDEALAESKEIIEQLDGIEQRQRDRLDDTFERLNAPSDAPWPKDDGSAEQKALQGDLQNLMKRLEGFTGKPSAPLVEAEKFMEGAGNALQFRRLDLARQFQSGALDQLRRARREATKSLGEALSKKGLQTFAKPSENGTGSDPFGRSRPGRGAPITGDGPKIPGTPYLDRAGEILEELRRRLNDPTRREMERDYIERLLKMY